MTPPVVDHIGIIVEDLDQALVLFDRVFNLKPSKQKTMPDVGLRIAQLEAANIHLELIQYIGQEEGFGQKVMGSRPGINHFSVQVGDIQETLNRFHDQGVHVMEGFPRPGSHGQVAFFDPASTNGILMEVCQPDEGED
jgi:methylmalonyl-CoA epimerase